MRPKFEIVENNFKPFPNKSPGLDTILCLDHMHDRIFKIIFSLLSLKKSLIFLFKKITREHCILSSTPKLKFAVGNFRRRIFRLHSSYRVTQSNVALF